MDNDATKTTGDVASHANGIATDEKASRAPRGSVVPTLGLWSQAARIGGGLTPAQIASIIREADAGDTRRLVDLANECRQQDSHLQAVLGTHEESIAGLSWQVIPPTPGGREKPRARDRRVATWCEEHLRNNPGVQRLIADLAGAYYYAFSVVEIVWRRDGANLVPERFVRVAPRRFRFRRVDGALVLSDDGMAEVDLPAQHPNKFIVSCPRVNGDVLNREGLMRPLVWMSCMRRWDIGDWLSTGEMAWKPWRIGKYKQGTAGTRDREDLETIIRRMTTDFTAVIPDSTEIEITWPAGSNSGRSTHAELCNVLAQEMSKAVLGQTETTQASASSGYAQAKVHDAVRRDLRESRARQIAADITRDLIAPMVRLNFGTNVEVPRFEFITQDPVDLKSFAEAVEKLGAAGLRIPSAWAYEQAGIPEPKEDEEVIGGSEDDAEEDDADESGDTSPSGEGEKPDEDDTPEAEPEE